MLIDNCKQIYRQVQPKSGNRTKTDYTTEKSINVGMNQKDIINQRNSLKMRMLKAKEIEQKLFRLERFVKMETGVESLIMRTNKREHVEARRLFSFIAVEIEGISLTRTGDFIRLDHSTIHAQVKKLKQDISIYPEIKKQLEDLIRKWNRITGSEKLINEIKRIEPVNKEHQELIEDMKILYIDWLKGNIIKM